MEIRLLEKRDKDEYLELINVFTREPKEITKEDFEKWYDLSFGQNALIYVLLQEDKIVGTGKLLVEYKFNNNLTVAGHIEDIVIHNNYRKQGLGKNIIDELTNISIQSNCYKIILDCNEKCVNFYQNSGFRQKEIQMVKYL